MLRNRQLAIIARLTKSGLLSLCTVGLVASVGTSVFAQQPSSATAGGPSDKSGAQSSATDSKIVTVLATVCDKHGKVVSNLSKDDFTLEQEGKPVTIQSFTKGTDLPLTLGLLVDTSLGQRSQLEQERSASKTFLGRALGEKDMSFVIHFDREVELMQDLTSSKEKLDAAVDDLQTASFRNQQESPESDPDSRGDDSPNMGRGRGMRRGGKTLYDAMFLASDELLKKQKGRKVIVLLADGVDWGSKESLESAIEAAQRADTVIYSVLFKGDADFENRRGIDGRPRIRGPLGGPMGGPSGGPGGGGRSSREQRPDGKKVLERITKETGGHLFEVSKKETLDQIFASIEEELHGQYSLTFTPDKTNSGEYHKIVLRAKPKDAEVQAREGFYLEP